jgi:hypothetical protein
MHDSDDIRRLVERRLGELRLKSAEVSRSLGQNRGYLFDYIRKGTPKVMDTETKLLLADRLQLPPQALGVPQTVIAARATHPGGFSDDAEPYRPGPNLAAPPPHIAMFRVTGKALDQHPRGLTPGKVIGININDVDPAHIQPGAIVIAQLYDRAELTRCHGTVLRQFLPPNKLTTNSSETNEIFGFDDPGNPFIAVIKGTLAWVLDDAPANLNGAAVSAA